MSKGEKKSILQKELNAKEVLVVMLVFIALLGYGYIFIYPKYKEYKTASDNLNSIESQLSELESKIGEMPSLQEKLDSLEKEIKVKSKIVSYNIEDGMFLIGLSKIMNEVDVELMEYSIDEPKEYNSFYALPTTIKVRGNYKHVREIIYYMEEQKNMTQVLDFNIETYIEKEENISISNNTRNIIPDSIVYWTDSSTMYHKGNCIVLENEKIANGGVVHSGNAEQSGKNLADEVCKPYTINTLSNQAQQSNESLRSKGEVTAIFKFVTYSSENPRLELENDDPTKWKPGKYNPFKTTSR